MFLLPSYIEIRLNTAQNEVAPFVACGVLSEVSLLHPYLHPHSKGGRVVQPRGRLLWPFARAGESARPERLRGAGALPRVPPRLRLLARRSQGASGTHPSLTSLSPPCARSRSRSLLLARALSSLSGTAGFCRALTPSFFFSAAQGFSSWCSTKTAGAWWACTWSATTRAS